MEELWQQTSEVLWQRPLLWIPVLIADLLGFLINIGAGALLQTTLKDSLQYRSALGGMAMRAPVSASALEHATLIALFITWSANLLRLLLYAFAFLVTATLVKGIATRAGKLHATVASAVRRHAGGAIALAFQAWVVYLLLALLFSWLSRALYTHGHKNLLANGWLEVAAGVLLFAVLALLLAPTALQTLTGRPPQPGPGSEAQMLGFALGVIALLLAHFVAENIHAVNIAEPAVRYALELSGSWIAALPYALMFVGFGRLAVRSEAMTELASAEHAD